MVSPGVGLQHLPIFVRSPFNPRIATSPVDSLPSSVPIFDSTKFYQNDQFFDAKVKNRRVLLGVALDL